jgi:hypothetical protein
MSKFYPQIEEEVAQQAYTHRFEFSYLDIPAGIPVTTSQIFLLPKVVAGDEVIELFVRLLTAFSGGGNTTVTLDIGDGTSPTTYATALAVGTTPISNQHVADKNLVYAAANQLQIRLNPAATFSLSNLTAGQLWIAWNIFRAADKPKNLIPPFGKGYT